MENCYLHTVLGFSDWDDGTVSDINLNAALSLLSLAPKI